MIRLALRERSRRSVRSWGGAESKSSYQSLNALRVGRKVSAVSVCESNGSEQTTHGPCGGFISRLSACGYK